MSIEVVHAGLTHRTTVSLWDGQARSLCGKTFTAGTFRENWFNGGVTCRDCKDAHKAGKTL